MVNMIRTFESEIEIDAPRATVWQIVGEVENAPLWAPTTEKVRALGGRTKNGTISINLNKAGFVVWPTTAKVVDYVPGEKLVNRIISGVEWTFELTEGAGGPGTTTLKEYRNTPSYVASFWENGVAKLTGGEDKFNAGLGKSVSASLKKIKKLAEQRAASA